jgi:hypothetical protein
MCVTTRPKPTQTLHQHTREHDTRIIDHPSPLGLGLGASIVDLFAFIEACPLTHPKRLSSTSKTKAEATMPPELMWTRSPLAYTN